MRGPGALAARGRSIQFSREKFVEDNLSERQQVDELMTMVRANAPYAIAGIVLGVAGLLGWQQWQAYGERQSRVASAPSTTVVAVTS